MKFYQWQPRRTPYSVKALLIITSSIAILSALLNGVFLYFGLRGPQDFLSLSWVGLKNFSLWQPITYLFVLESGFQGITLSFLTALCVSMYLLWILGSSIEERIGKRHFLTLYFGSGIIAGLVAVFTMALLHKHSPLLGPSAALLGLFIFWTMFHAQSEIFLFFFIPMKIKWILTCVLSLIALMCLLRLDLVTFLFYATAAACGYLYGRFVFDLSTPFEEGIEEEINHSKVIDVKPILNDNAFVDEMLTKISKYGEESLTAAEKRRLEQISKNKMKK